MSSGATENEYSVTKAGVAIIAIATGIIFMVVVYALINGDYREMKNAARLVPAHEATPALPDALLDPAFPIKIAKNALLIFFGTNVASAVEMPHTIVKMGDDDVLAIDKDKQDIVIHTLKLYDAHDLPIVRIDDDGFWVEKSTRIKKPNSSTFVVADYNDTELLRITYLNPKALSILGTFRHPGVPPMVVTSQIIQYDGRNLGDNVFKESAQADIELGKKKQIDYIINNLGESHESPLAASHESR